MDRAYNFFQCSVNESVHAVLFPTVHLAITLPLQFYQLPIPQFHNSQRSFSYSMCLVTDYVWYFMYSIGELSSVFGPKVFHYLSKTFVRPKMNKEEKSQIFLLIM